MKMGTFFTFLWRSICPRTFTISNLTHRHHHLLPQNLCHHRLIRLVDSHIHHHHHRNTDKLIILTNYCYEGSFARVNCMLLLNFSLFRFSTAQGKGRLLISGLWNAISFSRTTRIQCAF